VPLDLAPPGSIVFSPNASSVTNQVNDKIWLRTNILAADVSLDHIGIRKGDMIAMPADYTWLSLATPNLSLPASIFNVLLQAAKTSPEQNFVLDCATASILPDLVFGLNMMTVGLLRETKLW
jgi:hypothetical protein